MDTTNFRVPRERRSQEVHGLAIVFRSKPHLWKKSKNWWGLHRPKSTSRSPLGPESTGMKWSHASGTPAGTFNRLTLKYKHSLAMVNLREHCQNPLCEYCYQNPKLIVFFYDSTLKPSSWLFPREDPVAASFQAKTPRHRPRGPRPPRPKGLAGHWGLPAAFRGLVVVFSFSAPLQWLA